MGLEDSGRGEWLLRVPDCVYMCALFCFVLFCFSFEGVFLAHVERLDVCFFVSLVCVLLVLALGVRA